MQLDFGRNWDTFSRCALTPPREAQARADFTQLFGGVAITGKFFLDVDFGQGLGLICLRHRPPRVPTGCSELVFRKTA